MNDDAIRALRTTTGGAITDLSTTPPVNVTLIVATVVLTIFAAAAMVRWFVCATAQRTRTPQDSTAMDDARSAAQDENTSTGVGD